MSNQMLLIIAPVIALSVLSFLVFFDFKKSSKGESEITPVGIIFSAIITIVVSGLAFWLFMLYMAK